MIKIKKVQKEKDSYNQRSESQSSAHPTQSACIRMKEFEKPLKAIDSEKHFTVTPFI
jgi:hypothetical protein